jgi:hypothetical protein
VDKWQRRPAGAARLAAHGLREAIRLLLETLAPDAPADSDGRVTRATRVAVVLGRAGGSLSVLGVAIQQAVVGAYPVLSDEAHHQNEKPRLTPVAMDGMFRIVEGLLMMLCSFASNAEAGRDE